jgi:hypothetical protein
LEGAKNEKDFKMLKKQLIHMVTAAFNHVGREKKRKEPLEVKMWKKALPAKFSTKKKRKMPEVETGQSGEKQMSWG